MNTLEENYLHLKIEAESARATSIHLPRNHKELVRKPGDLLWENREGPDEIRRQKAVMGKWKYARPVPAGPESRKAARSFNASGSAIASVPRSLHRDGHSAPSYAWSFRVGTPQPRKRNRNDYWACTTWGLVVGDDARIRMLDSHDGPDGVRRRAAEGQGSVREMEGHHGGAESRIRAAATAIISELRTTGHTLLPISPSGSDKEANARAVSPMFEAGMILLPDDAEWADDYIRVR